MEYLALDPSQRQTRILHLHPGQPVVDVACHLSVISLDNQHVEYEALSYVWGESTKNRVVHMEGVSIPITNNLWQALTGLRCLDRDRVLLVDALCINQFDNNERSHQVSRMNSIYTQASSVEIWLGESYEGVENALKFFTELATGLTAEGKTASYAHLEDAVPRDFGPETADEDWLDEKALECMELLLAIDKFATNPWFQRVWTIQEFFLAKKSTFHCGAQVLDGATFMQAMNHLVKHNNKRCCAFFLPVDFQMILNTFFVTTRAIRELKTGPMKFLNCVGGFRSRKATDPRDKIYSLLGLGVDDFVDLIQPEYIYLCKRSLRLSLLHFSTIPKKRYL